MYKFLLEGYLLLDMLGYFLNLKNFRVAKISGKQWVQYGGARI